MNERRLYAATLVGILSVATLLWTLTSWQEAAAYNRLTGGSATTWDAMFVELRVVGRPAE